MVDTDGYCYDCHNNPCECDHEANKIAFRERMKELDESIKYYQDKRAAELAAPRNWLQRWFDDLTF